jgi:hypothetical protein
MDLPQEHVLTISTGKFTACSNIDKFLTKNKQTRRNSEEHNLEYVVATMRYVFKV